MATSWVDFIGDWSFVTGRVVLDAYLDDHVPLALKTRALRRLGCDVILLGGPCAGPLLAATIRAGARWVDVTATADLTAAVLEPPGACTTAFTTAAPDLAALLTDRQLQVCGLLASRHHPTVGQVGRWLGVASGTVLVHLRSARRTLTAAGHDVSSRERLRIALEETGVVVPVADMDRWRPRHPG